MFFKDRLRADMELARKIEKILLNSLWDGFESYVCYGGNSINMYDNKGSGLYIRLTYEEVGKVAVDIANVVLEPSKRRKGNFTKLFNELLNSKYTTKVIISSVISNEMLEFCKKNNMIYYEPYDLYYIDTSI